MSNENELNPQNDDLAPIEGGKTRLQSLKEKATMLGITFSNNIGEEALAKKIEDKLAGTTTKDDGDKDEQLNPLVGDVAGQKPLKQLTIREQLLREEMRLIRVRITCMDPKKADLKGEIYTVANEYIGNVKKFVPYGEATDDGYHVPKCILTLLQEKRFLQTISTRNQRTKMPEVKTAWVKEFAIEILPQLTEAELKQLATAQIAAGTVGVNSDE
ncbi:MAG: hypothetical protein ACK5LG_21985 [Bacteroides thetaiotaomicron]